ncbi:forespore capture DNA-binding protein RefZ [Priestia flexa]|uniref:Forespore capture DNA-binding protein RefZ n=1 Tax=Priestia flexa TaxID=86664 RepID=A0ABU4J8Z5_9BACI|nr:forespore capture DNA-binding protein RefZ [Priestia flexa]MBY6085429.1 forespore capture DNA-binding protein RefZ [Priestia flexa]MCA1200957.1 forespore capture DNA-binding protein RefZ [Priestia flexa]MCG7311562.1 forespore capture DNA-binding protein RefZ [Priestia flexa]MCP1190924.1 forespore capture DNA-binding protein RefZ [Priestia flexa]MDW8517439.1 forespore capture DNA-binding protein RefZ [Priestia flexa]
MVAQAKTKERIIDAAVSLFNAKGFDGTSVREIATKAKVNVANISYYFEGKEGLLETLVTTYFEGYIAELENEFELREYKDAKECLQGMVSAVLNYQHENRTIARLVYREISLDTTFIREVMTTYLTKEKYYLKTVLEKGMEDREFRKVNPSFIIIQLKALLSMPYLHPQYLTEVLYIMPQETYFLEQYNGELTAWIRTMLYEQREPKKQVYVRLTRK